MSVGGLSCVIAAIPVVPRGQARIRTQISAAHTQQQLERAVEAFTRIGQQLGVIA